MESNQRQPQNYLKNKLKVIMILLSHSRVLKPSLRLTYRFSASSNAGITSKLVAKSGFEPLTSRLWTLRDTTIFCSFQKNQALLTFREVEWLIRFCIECAEKEIVEVALPYVLFQEGCDWGDSTEKEQIADLFVDLKDKWKSPKFNVSSCRNTLLRFAMGKKIKLLNLIPFHVFRNNPVFQNYYPVYQK